MKQSPIIAHRRQGVSLRGRAVDGAGDTAEQTIIRAYRIRPS
ncbi:hypothetical protein ABZ907_20645 [Nonomuraea wenchangensis]